MKKRREWQRLKSYARKLYVKLLFLKKEDFDNMYAPGIFSLFDPMRMKVVMSSECFENEELALFSLAHELGHVVDHISEPHRSEEYRFYYLLDSFYSTFPLPSPEVCRSVFQDREDVATIIGLSILEEIGVTLEMERLKDYPFILEGIERASSNF